MENNHTKPLFLIAGLLVMTALAGCTTPTQGGPVKGGQMNIIAGGVGQDIPARIYQEYGSATSCHPESVAYATEHDVSPFPCPDNNGFPHIGHVCPNMKWSVQFRNDHPTDSNEEKYGIPFDGKLVNSLQQWRAEKQELRFYWVRYSDTQCKFTENEVIYCVELTSLSLKDSENHGCIKAMHRTFPGLNPAWDQSLGFATPSDGVADASAGAEGGAA